MQMSLFVISQRALNVGESKVQTWWKYRAAAVELRQTEMYSKTAEWQLQFHDALRPAADWQPALCCRRTRTSSYTQ